MQIARPVGLGVITHASRSPSVGPGRGAEPLSDVPSGPVPPTRPSSRGNHPSLLGATWGVLRPAVAAVALAAMLTGPALAQNGAPPLPQNAVETVTLALPDAIGVIDTPSGTAAMELDRLYRDLDALLQEQRISPIELNVARDLLKRALIDRDPSIQLPKDYRGRVDLVLLAQQGTQAQGMSRGERVFATLSTELERRMRITARDMAAGNFVPLEGLPGYKEIPVNDVKELVTRAIRDVPLGELPGGAAVAHLVEALPNMAGVDATKLSSNELARLVGDRQQAWLEARLGPVLEHHKVEATLVAFAAITGARAASPALARFMDRLGVQVTAYTLKTEDGGLYSRGRLVYRDGNILPDLDIENGARRVIGNTTLRAVVTSTASLESDRHFSGSATVGARYDEGRYWLDSTLTYRYPEERLRTELRGGYIGSDYLLSGAVSSTYGPGVAVGDAPGRLSLELDLTKDLRLSGGVNGDFGVYVGAGSDSDGSHSDVRAGLMLRLHW